MDERADDDGDNVKDEMLNEQSEDYVKSEDRSITPEGKTPDESINSSSDGEDKENSSKELAVEDERPASEAAQIGAATEEHEEEEGEEEEDKHSLPDDKGFSADESIVFSSEVEEQQPIEESHNSDRESESVASSEQLSAEDSHPSSIIDSDEQAPADPEVLSQKENNSNSDDDEESEFPDCPEPQASEDPTHEAENMTTIDNGLVTHNETNDIKLFEKLEQEIESSEAEVTAEEPLQTNDSPDDADRSSSLSNTHSDQEPKTEGTLTNNENTQELPESFTSPDFISTQQDDILPGVILDPVDCLLIANSRIDDNRQPETKRSPRAPAVKTTTNNRSTTATKMQMPTKRAIPQMPSATPKQPTTTAAAKAASISKPGASTKPPAKTTTTPMRTAAKPPMPTTNRARSVQRTPQAARSSVSSLASLPSTPKVNKKYANVQSKVGSITAHRPSGGNVEIFHEKKTYNVTSKVGSLEKAGHVPGGGNVKIETTKTNFSETAKPRIDAKSEHIPKPSNKKIPVQKLNWSAESKVGSLDNAKHKPGGGNVKVLNDKIQWNASSKVGSKDNIGHKPGGGNVKTSPIIAESKPAIIKAEVKTRTNSVGGRSSISSGPLFPATLTKNEGLFLPGAIYPLTADQVLNG